MLHDSPVILDYLDHRAGGAKIVPAEPDARFAALTLQVPNEFNLLQRTAHSVLDKPQWCDRSLLARIHRYTLNRLRAEIEPVDAADFMRFLFVWQHLDANGRLSGIDGLRAVVALLDGFEAPAAAWERTILPARMDRYDPALLDLLCLTGEVGWARLSPAATSVGGTTPIAIFLREHAAGWLALRSNESAADMPLSALAAGVLSTIEARGAMFSRDLAATVGGDDDALHGGLAAAIIGIGFQCDGVVGLPGFEREGAGAGRMVLEPGIAQIAIDLVLLDELVIDDGSNH